MASEITQLRYEVAQLRHELGAFMDEIRAETRQQGRLWDSASQRIEVLEKERAAFNQDQIAEAVKMGLRELISLRNILAVLSVPIVLTGLFQIILRFIAL
jgi:DNA integrity scanning protein DisA with diadenylate cyclase activity